MEELLTFLIRPLLTSPDALKIVRQEEDYEDVYTIHLDPADAGLVIGKQGRIIRALRAAARVRAGVENKRVFVKLADETVRT